MSGRERILLVEDDDDMRTACRKYLESAKFEVLEASSPRGAEAVMLRENVQLILTDLRMPGGGGEAVVKLGHSILREVPIVIITAYPSVKSAIDSFKSGVVDYLIKPFTGEQLQECVERVLAEKRARDGFQALLPPSAGDPAESEIVGSSAPLREVLAEIRRVAAATGPVLITVRTAQGAHRAVDPRSLRRAGGPSSSPAAPSCHPIPRRRSLRLREPRLPGQPASRSGLVEEATMGLLLDEVGDLSSNPRRSFSGSWRRKRSAGWVPPESGMWILGSLLPRARTSRGGQGGAFPGVTLSAPLRPGSASSLLRERKEDIPAIAVKILTA